MYKLYIIMPSLTNPTDLPTHILVDTFDTREDADRARFEVQALLCAFNDVADDFDRGYLPQVRVNASHARENRHTIMAVSRETTSVDDLDPFGRDRFVAGQLVWMVGSFYGGEQKAIVTGRGEWDCWREAWYWPVRVTSRHTIYGGYRCGERTTVSLPCIRNRRV